MSTLNIAIQIAGQDQGAGALISRLAGGLGDLGGVATGALTLGLGAATVGIGALAAGLGLALTEAMGAQEIMAQTQAVIKSTGGAAGMTAEAVADLATQLSLQSRFSDDAIQAGENLLLTFTNIGADTFPAATQAMVDMAAAMGTDVKGGAIQLGKALNDPIAGVSALSRVGVTFTEDQKNVIKSLVETGDVAGAQAIILAELNKEFGGSAAASAETFAGKLDVVKNQLLNVAEAIGGPLLDMGAQLIDTLLLPLVPIIETVGGAFTDFLATFAAGDFEDPIGNLANLFYTVANALGLDGAGIFGAVIALREPFDSLIAAIQVAIPAIQSAFQTAWDFIVLHAEEIKAALIAVGAVLGGAAIIGAIAAIGGLIAGLLSPVGLIIAAAALLGAAWAGNWGGIRDILTEFWTNTAQPILLGLWEWLQVAVPAALQTLSNFWTGTLLPAINAVWAWVQTALFPMLVELGTWLATNIPIALQALSDFWTGTLLPAINAVWAWITGTLFPALNDLWTWLSATLTAALTSLSTYWTTTLLPAITAVWQFITDDLQPLFVTLVDFFNAAFTLALTALAGLWENVLQPALKAIGDYLSVTLQPIFDGLVDFWENTLGPKLTTVKEGILDKLPAVFEGIKDAIGWVTDKLSGLTDALGKITLPWWLTPGSPTPWENGLVGIGQAMSALTQSAMPALNASLKAQANLNAPVGAAGGAATVIDNRQYIVQAQYGNQAEGTVAQEMSLLARMRA